jgi:hypothetical protein
MSGRTNHRRRPPLRNEQEDRAQTALWECEEADPALNGRDVFHNVPNFAAIAEAQNSQRNVRQGNEDQTIPLTIIPLKIQRPE